MIYTDTKGDMFIKISEVMGLWEMRDMKGRQFVDVPSYFTTLDEDIELPDNEE